ncbi:hypothetical protein K5I29_01135 [Flavobacterium agricola]|uniref:EF-hand domain-containing protein n=1 Tax=Flavobacterium agricola TaxID=2870839 RepID=A0ABY6LZV9_9FLAO|nr:hypothetical protein [Flavobacterium agricola]UYW01562.1 hypothetical protein K5I29_01135 [Flavobacterium agricola]
MKKLFLYSLPFALLAAVSSCVNNEEPKPKVVYKEKEVVTTEVKRDTTILKVSDLPVHMDGSKYLIFPIGDIRIYDDSKYASYGRSKINPAISYAISNYNRYEITGFFENLKFQHIDSTSFRTLTDKVLQIQTATYLNTIAAKSNKKILIYTITDADTNGDQKVNANDIKSLYISAADGTKFKKLSHDYQELIDWNIVEAANRLYFRSIEDINKNGVFDSLDKLHYYYVNLLDTAWQVHEYDAVQNLSAADFMELNKPKAETESAEEQE